jgi:hypothetical protein
MKVMRNLAAGAAAGVVGTVALDVANYARYRRNGGKESFWRWECASDVMSWDDTSAPGQVGEKVLHAVAGRRPPDEWARTTTNVVHWATGVGWGMQYGVLASRTSRFAWARALALGPVVWLFDYSVLPLAKVYQPIWNYDARTLRDDLAAHVIYGTVSSAVFGALTRG